MAASSHPVSPNETVPALIYTVEGEGPTAITSATRATGQATYALTVSRRPEMSVGTEADCAEAPLCGFMAARPPGKISLGGQDIQAVAVGPLAGTDRSYRDRTACTHTGAVVQLELIHSCIYWLFGHIQCKQGCDGFALPARSRRAIDSGMRGPTPARRWIPQRCPFTREDKQT